MAPKKRDKEPDGPPPLSDFSEESSDDGDDWSKPPRGRASKRSRVCKETIVLLNVLIQNGVSVKGRVSPDGIVEYVFHTSKTASPSTGKSVTFASDMMPGGVPLGPPPEYGEMTLSRPKHSSGRKKVHERRRRGLFF